MSCVALPITLAFREHHSSCMAIKKKRVTFSSECKDYDGPKTRHNFLYAVLLIAFFKGNLKTKEDILRCCEDDRDFIDFCLRESIITTKKFAGLREREKEYYKECRKRVLLNDDPLWDTSFFLEKSRVSLRPGIAAIRTGTSIRIANFKFYTEHLPIICNFIELLHSADEHLFECNK